MFRSTTSEDLFMSEFTKAAYQRAFSLDKLKLVVTAEFNKKGTLGAVKRIYKPQRLSHPSSTKKSWFPSGVQHTWYPSPPEHQIILETGIGRVIAAFVLWCMGPTCQEDR
ncbi:hypothetical protein PENANT_c001G11418 [Penicillium antarcticum]|uniref:Uncharacterized protein n=1 Tax=Penicillium antarcticum TaxID=416450 RepID=A0A1V6QP79_9EURO|nr:uncharacterized protein N7508_010833 [Penicillium antarcticum]KAJ5296012.1 hypothetical protein N7508_010833 [Penicillium antarcticum]OQD91033.1 hypothetical protein PENANT_c001G11418 [Penicillium antarcticum]